MSYEPDLELEGKMCDMPESVNISEEMDSIFQKLSNTPVEHGFAINVNEYGFAAVVVAANQKLTKEEMADKVLAIVDEYFGDEGKTLS